MADNKDCKLFIGNITYNTRERELEDLFSKYGRLKEVRVAIDGSTGRSRGYAFVTMENAQDAEEAVKQVAGMEIDGRAIRVEISTGERRNPVGGDRGGDRNGGSRGGDRDRGGRDFDRDRNGDRGGDRGGRDRSRDRGGRDDRDSGRDRRDFGRDRDSGRDNGRDRDGGRDGGRGGDRDNGRDRRDRDRSPVARRDRDAPAERSRSRDRGDRGDRGDRAAPAAAPRSEGRRDRSRDR